MKHLIKYKLFEDNNSDELVDLIRSELDGIDINQFDLYLSSCVYKSIKGSTQPYKLSSLHYNRTGELLNTFNQEIKLGMPSYNNSYRLRSKSDYTTGLVLMYKKFDYSLIEINKILNSLNRDRFLEYGFNYKITTDSRNISVILFYKTTSFFKESQVWDSEKMEYIGPTDKDIAKTAKQDLDDILIYLKDDVFNVDVRVVMDYHANLFVDIMDYSNKPVLWKDIKDDVERGIEVVSDRFRPSTVYFRVLDKNGKITGNKDRDTRTWEDFIKMRFTHQNHFPVRLHTLNKDNIEDVEYFNSLPIIDDVYLAFLSIELNQII